MEFECRLLPPELRILRGIPDELRQALTDPERAAKVVDRLFPPAHDDPAEQQVHRRLLGDSLLQERLAATTEFSSTLDRVDQGTLPHSVVLTPAEFDLWLHVINDLRLVLGTELDIHDNEWSLRQPRRRSDRRAHRHLIALTAIQAELLEAVE